MCGRFVVSYTYDELLQYLDETFKPYQVNRQLQIPDYNVAPSKDIIVLIYDGKQYRVGTIKWGFKPFEQFKYPIINVRRETIDEKPIYKQAFTTRRCLLFANGFYEWKAENYQKIPHYIYPQDHQVFLFAGIYTQYTTYANETQFSVAIVTKEATDTMKPLHDRMPVILTKEDAKKWLKKDQSIETLKSLFKTDNVALNYYQVSQRVNNVHNNTIENIKKM
ncbi:MAG: SOS response-associated peptidase [Candidatus Izimaplasma sp.]|nr:SOS response-associated peptidase [Candidatus Izimaplasma bacterium]